MKHWSRQWKINVIARDNPHSQVLYPQFFTSSPSFE
jgi:predicted GIY-YIG superfamily endonuclease